MKIELRRINENELKKAFKMHRKGFLPTFIKYKDWGFNPIFQGYSKIKNYYNHENMFMYFIICDSIAVGQIWIYIKDDSVKLARLFVLKEYQNQGIATEAIRLAEQIFSDRQRWWLDTIKQEKNNCHLYEKMGYRQTGKEKRINRRMTIVDYEKEIKNE